MIDPAPGILLIADPFLKDPNFLRTVVFLCEHKEEGSFGFVLNKRYHYTLAELLPEFTNLQIPVYYGGPVQEDSIHFLHSCPEDIPGGQEVVSGIYWGGNFEILVAKLKDGSLDMNKIRFFIGYSGWGNGQLAEELTERSWITSDTPDRLLFETAAEDIWKEALTHLGGEYQMMINFPIDPQLN